MLEDSNYSLKQLSQSVSNIKRQNEFIESKLDMLMELLSQMLDEVAASKEK